MRDHDLKGDEAEETCRVSVTSGALLHLLDLVTTSGCLLVERPSTVVPVAFRSRDLDSRSLPGSPLEDAAEPRMLEVRKVGMTFDEMSVCGRRISVGMSYAVRMLVLSVGRSESSGRGYQKESKIREADKWV